MYRRIMVPLDGSELAECVLPHVEALASGCAIVDVVLVRVVEPFHLQGGEAHLTPEQREGVDSIARAEASEYLGRLARRLRPGSARVQKEVLYGKVTDSLVDYTKKNNIDLVIIATHGRSGISHLVRGSVAEHILNSVCVPILMVRAPGCVAGI
jgi:nucleotide-binding universal stress UspA family protein